MHLNRSLLVTAVAVVAMASPLRADPIAWSFSWAPSASTIQADSGGLGSVTLTGGTSQNAFGNSFVVAANLQTSSSATATDPSTLSANGGYQLNLTIKDTASQQSATLSFLGKLSGTFSSVSSNLTNAFLSPVSQSVTLGGNLYTITLEKYLPPGPPGAKLRGAIGAAVTVSGPGGNPKPSSVPEPASLLLCGIGLVVTLAGCRRRRSSAER
jgi:hypothetical protein